MTKNKNYIIGMDAIDALQETEADRENAKYGDPLHIILHLKQRMTERGLTQMQLAEMSGVRQATISQFARGNIERLHIPSLEKIARAMDITDITQLLTFELESEIMNMANPFGIEYPPRNPK